MSQYRRWMKTAVTLVCSADNGLTACIFSDVDVGIVVARAYLGRIRGPCPLLTIHLMPGNILLDVILVIWNCLIGMFSDHGGNPSKMIMRKTDQHNIKLGVIRVGSLQSKFCVCPCVAVIIIIIIIINFSFSTSKVTDLRKKEVALRTGCMQ